ncbi:MAG TPA: substrate-binding domain-containing protein [Victivallales bacterium]|nr:substrate-binding domain-containing protein [Victivallales bacterium]
MFQRTKQLKYIFVAQEIERLIEKSALGDRLPSDREIARTFGCSPLTARKALDTFARKGIIVRKVGSGTFVNGVTIPESRFLNNISEIKIAVLVHSQADEYALTVLNSINERAKEKNIILELGYISDFGDDSLRKIDDLEKKGVVAAILSWFPPNQISELVNFMRKVSLPIVLPALIPGFEKNCFERSELYGRGTITQTYGACLYFQNLEIKNIVLLGPNFVEDTIMQKRIAAYSDFCFRNNFQNYTSLVGEKVEEMDECALKIRKIGQSTAIICHDDLHALRFMNAMRKLGLSSPGDFCILGCNNTKAGLYADPPLSSIYDDPDYSGRQLLISAIALAEGKIKQSEKSAEHYLVIRKSCGGAKKINEKIISVLKQNGIILINEG